MEKAKTHYDAKKQQNQELQEQLRGLEQLQTENKSLGGMHVSSSSIARWDVGNP